jgi:type VI secretion system protein ImpK
MSVSTYDAVAAREWRRMPIHYGALVRELMSFYLLLLREKEEAEVRAAPAEGTADPSEALAGRILGRLEAALRDQWERARQVLSDRERTDLRDTQYLMCALADDMFLYDVAWRGRDAWSLDLLEQRVFATRIAGERVFEKAEILLRRRDPADAEFATVLLATIGLGFKGRYRDPDQAPYLDTSARALFEMLSGRTAAPGLTKSNLVPAAIGNVLVGQRHQRRVPVNIGVATLLGIAAAFLIISTIVWFTMTSDIAGAANAVLQAAE